MGTTWFEDEGAVWAYVNNQYTGSTYKTNSFYHKHESWNPVYLVKNNRCIKCNKEISPFIQLTLKLEID